MLAPEFVVHVLATAGPVGLAYLIMRNLPRVTWALLVALATIVAIFTQDEKRRQCGLEVLSKLTGRDDDTGNGPPELPKP